MLAGAAVFAMTACGGSKAPLSAIEDVFFNDVQPGNGYNMSRWESRAIDLKSALEGQTFDVEVADPEGSPFTIEHPFTVGHVQDNPRDGWLPQILLQGTITTEDYDKILHETLGYMGTLNVTLYGVDEEGKYHLVAALKFNEDAAPIYDPDTHELHLVAKIGAEHISVSNERKLRQIAHCTRFVITYDPLPSAEKIEQEAFANDNED